MRKLDLRATPEDDGERLDRFLAQRGKIARAEARRLLARGAVWIDGLRVKIASKPVHAGQQVVAVLEEAGREAPTAVPFGPDRILFRDEHVIAVDKPAFVPAQATLASDQGSLPALVSELVRRPVGMVHRLDLETTGVTLFGLTKPATTALAAAFREGTVRKKYVAVAWGALPDSGVIDAPLGPDPKRPGRFVAGPSAKLPATTRFEVAARKGSLLLVAAYPETGRTHQIRVHLSSRGAPLVGDDLYGGPASLAGPDGTGAVGRFLLHARSVRLPHPATGEPLEVVARMPEDFGPALRALAVDPARL